MGFNLGKVERENKFNNIRKLVIFNFKTFSNVNLNVKCFNLDV